MKVRHKATGVELDVKEESFLYWTTKGNSLISKGDSDWQLVPEEEWEDCTGFCEIATLPILDDGRNTIVYRCGKGISFDVLNTFQLSENFHVKKIDGMHHGPAFIVERRKE